MCPRRSVKGTASHVVRCRTAATGIRVQKKQQVHGGVSTTMQSTIQRPMRRQPMLLIGTRRPHLQGVAPVPRLPCTLVMRVTSVLRSSSVMRLMRVTARRVLTSRGMRLMRVMVRPMLVLQRLILLTVKVWLCRPQDACALPPMRAALHRSLTETCLTRQLTVVALGGAGVFELNEDDPQIAPRRNNLQNGSICTLQALMKLTYKDKCYRQWRARRLHETGENAEWSSFTASGQRSHWSRVRRRRNDRQRQHGGRATQGTLPFERAAVDSDRAQSLQQERFLDRMPERARRAPLEKELSIFETFVRGERKNRTVRYKCRAASFE